MTIMKVINTDQYGVTYADPSDPDFQIRFKTTNGQKSVDGRNVRNYVTEVIITDNSVVGEMNEALSVRLRTSGSAENKERLEFLLDTLAGLSQQIKDDSILFGFRPTNSPL